MPRLEANRFLDGFLQSPASFVFQQPWASDNEQRLRTIGASFVKEQARFGFYTQTWSTVHLTEKPSPKSKLPATNRTWSSASTAVCSQPVTQGYPRHWSTSRHFASGATRTSLLVLPVHHRNKIQSTSQRNLVIPFPRLGGSYTAVACLTLYYRLPKKNLGTFFLFFGVSERT